MSAPRRNHSLMSEEERIEYKRELGRIRNRRYRKLNNSRLKSEYASDHEKRRKHSEVMRKIYLKRQEELKERQRLYYQKNKQRILEYVRSYGKRKEVREKRSRVEKAKRQSDPEWKARTNKYKTDHIKRKLKNNAAFRLFSNLRKRLRSYVPRRGARTISLIGCSLNELAAHLSSKWEPWMNWDNYGFGEGRWVVDHIKPCCKFDLSDIEQQKLCFHFSNLRPLCWRQNMEKSDYYEEDLKSNPHPLCAPPNAAASPHASSAPVMDFHCSSPA